MMESVCVSKGMLGQTAAAVTQAITDPLTHKSFSVFVSKVALRNCTYPIF